MYTGKSPFDVQTTSNSVEFTYVTYCLVMHPAHQLIILYIKFVNPTRGSKDLEWTRKLI